MTAGGYIVAECEITVSSKVSGRVAILNVREGTLVRKGDIIATLDNEELKVKVEEAKANLRKASFNLKHKQELYEKDVVDLGRRKKSVLYFITLLLLNISLLANLAFLNIRERREYLSLLKAEIRKIESQALLLERKLLRTQILQDYRNSGKLSVGLLAELYRVAPSGMQLTSLEMRGQSPEGLLVLIGQAQDTQSVLNFAALIKESYLINQADVNHITKRRFGSEEVVDFEIRCTF